MTSIWLINLSRQLTKAILDGFDISNDQFPPKQCLSKNVALRTLDVLSPVPEELVGRYDVVHVRLFLCVVRDNDPSVIISNLARLLSQYFFCHILFFSSLSRARVAANHGF